MWSFSSNLFLSIVSYFVVLAMVEAVRKGITHFLIKNVQGDISVLVSASKLLCEYPQCIPVGYERARLCEVVISNIAAVPMPKPQSSQVLQLVKQVWKIQDLKFHSDWMQWGLSSQAVSHVKGKWMSILEIHYFSHQDCIPLIMKIMTVSMNWEFFFVDLQNEWLLLEQHCTRESQLVSYKSWLKRNEWG